MAVCGAECINLTKIAIKILRFYFSYNKQVKNNKNFLKHTKNLNLW